MCVTRDHKPPDAIATRNRANAQQHSTGPSLPPAAVTPSPTVCSAPARSRSAPRIRPSRGEETRRAWTARHSPIPATTSCRPMRAFYDTMCLSYDYLWHLRPSVASAFLDASTTGVGRVAAGGFEPPTHGL